MSWEIKKRGSSRGYYYHCERRPGRPNPVRVYLGKGIEAEQAAEQIKTNRRRRRDERDTVAATIARYADADQLAKEVEKMIGLLATAWLLLNGHHQHKNEWRRKRGYR